MDLRGAGLISAQDKIAFSADDRKLPRLRPELVVSEHIYDGQPYWVYKDPLSLRYYRFNREEHFIIQQFRRGATLLQLMQAHQQEFRHSNLTNQELGQFVSALTEKNLLIMSQPNRDEILFRAGKKKRQKKLLAQMTSLMYIKIPLYDPDRLFDRVINRLRFFWSRIFFGVYLLLMVVALVLVLDRWHDFSGMFESSFFTIYNMPLMIAVFWLVKAVHEFGHGLTCKNYGGEVHELGIMFLVFFPLLYCNITDSWTFPGKIQRLLVTAGGIMAELLLAALAAILWYFTEQPGFIHALAFNLIIVCSISTILFNANPLLRYDGYYMLMDIIEVPNLRQRASALMRRFFVRYILGGRSNELPEEHRFRFVFPIYSIAAFIYLWFIKFAILYMVYTMLKQIHLAVLGKAVVLFSVVTMMLVPLYKTTSAITTQREAMGISQIRLLLLLAVIFLLVAGALFWPFEQQVTLNFILEPVRWQWLRCEVDGQLHWNEHITEGTWLEENAPPVARLINPRLDYEAQKLSSQIEQTRIDIALWRSRDDLNQVQRLQERLKTFLQEQKRLQEQLAHTQVTVDFAGEVLSSDEQLKQMEGKYVLQGAPLFLLADSRQLTAKVWVPEKTLPRIFRTPDQRDQSARLMLYAFSKDIFHGRVSDLSRHREDSMGQFGEKMALSNKVGGEVLTEYDPATQQERPMEAVYEITIQLNKDTIPASARPYMSGRVQIDCGRSTFYRWATDALRRFISPEVRL